MDLLGCFVPDSIVLAPSGHGPLDGIRIAVKDLFDVADHTSSFGLSRWRETHDKAKVTSIAVEKLLAAGGTIVGLTKMDQLAYSLIGDVAEGRPPQNPFDPRCFCGGSSSGTASAVAGGLAELGLGTDTAGSIRVPAGATGLYGIRPSHGAISTDGVIPLAPSFDVVGLLARSADMLMRGYRALSSLPEKNHKFRRLIVVDSSSAIADRAAFKGVRRLISSIGTGEVSFLSPQATEALLGKEVGNLFARLQSREIWRVHRDWIIDHGSHLANDVRLRLNRCETLSKDPPSVIDGDAAQWQRYLATISDLLGDDGLLVLPVLPKRGPFRDWDPEALVNYRTACFRLTAPSSLTGFPQMVFPSARPDEDEAPTAASLLGPEGSDLGLLRLGCALER